MPLRNGETEIVIGATFDHTLLWEATLKKAKSKSELRGQRLFAGIEDQVRILHFQNVLKFFRENARIKGKVASKALDCTVQWVLGEIFIRWTDYVEKFGHTCVAETFL